MVAPSSADSLSVEALCLNASAPENPVSLTGAALPALPVGDEGNKNSDPQFSREMRTGAPVRASETTGVGVSHEECRTNEYD